MLEEIPSASLHGLGRRPETWLRGAFDHLLTARSLLALASIIPMYMGNSFSRGQPIVLDSVVHAGSNRPCAVRAFMGRQMSPAIRRAVVRHLEPRADHVSLEPEVGDLLLDAFDDGIEPGACVTMLAGSRDARIQAEALRRLWPVARRTERRWAGVDHEPLYRMVVRLSADPAPIAELIDTLTDRPSVRALFVAITSRPHRGLVPALERWSAANPGRPAQRLVQPVIEACQVARPPGD